jgi:hypothetical protein
MRAIEILGNPAVGAVCERCEQLEYAPLPLLDRRGGCAKKENIAKRPLTAQTGWLFKFDQNT